MNYQEKYLAHQERKAKSLTSTYGVAFKDRSKKDKEVFFDILKKRSSQRVFNNEKIAEHELDDIKKAIILAPSSCNRSAVFTRLVTKREDKEFLSGILVGGVGWIYRADTILLLFADMGAYKNPAEQDFMPYLDAGVIVQTVYLTAEAMNIGCCFVNPNIRIQNEKLFKQRFDVMDNLLFCGAIALGKYNFKHNKE